MKKPLVKKPEKTAVVGMSNVFPNAFDSQTFCKNILNKQNCIIDVPEGRWPGPVGSFISKKNMPDRAVSSKAGLIENFNFDPGGFLIDQDLLTELDPMHQLVLDAGRKALSQCFISGDIRKNTGVILAAISLPTDSANELSHSILFDKNYHPEPKNFSRASVVSFPAALLAGSLGLGGGSFTLDAACASSLFSIKLACEMLSLKKADAMIAGGVSRPDCLYTQIGFTQLMALSPSGKCSAFDRDADGLVVGEGAGIIVLKRFEDAIACGDKIFCVITGTGVSNDIEGTLVGPASEGQVRAMKEAYLHAGWSPEHIQYMECHGSGTPVGDQIEITSIQTLLENFGCRDSHLAIGSVKSMIGHLLTAAGAAGFIKTVLAMNQGLLPPSLNYHQPPDNSPLNRTNIRVQKDAREWVPQKISPADPLTRKAGISAFGFGGINAHILVEEYKKDSRQYYFSSSHDEKSRNEAAGFRTVPCAVVGAAAVLKDCTELSEFSDIVSGKFRLRPETFPARIQINHSDDSAAQKISVAHYDYTGFFITDLASEPFAALPGEFHIPPNQIREILPQHMILLKAVKNALEDAGISKRPLDNEGKREKFGCAVGIEFDFGAANFHSRWIEKGRNKDSEKLFFPLNFNRTLGALGGIAASRVAREFRLGGPCFTLSAGAAGGIKAVETGIHSLSSGETDLFICAGVDLAGDVRQLVLNRNAGHLSDTIYPSEGAGALILKRLDQALAENDRIYAVIKGTGSSGGGPVPGETDTEPETSFNLYRTSFENALKHAGTAPQEIAFYEKCGSGITEYDEIEERFLKTCLPQLYEKRDGIGCTSENLGNAFGCASLFSIIKTALVMDSGSKNGSSRKTDRLNTACAASMTMDGAFAHVILESAPGSDPGPRGDTVRNQNRVPGLDIKEKIEPGWIAQSSGATSRAHEKFLNLSRENMALYGQQFETLTRIVSKLPRTDSVHINKNHSYRKPLFDRDQCLEFAVGKAGSILGKDFDIIDTYPVRVRLPDEPLMLVDRIIDIQGEPLSLGSGKIITQHDVKPGAWYLDGFKMPVSVTIEAGQADLFLCSWLGIDHRVKGKRKYRLLDARVTFHRTLPEPGETIEYHIEIERFLKQGDVYLFFFHYKGFIDNDLLISMRDGCAGFFTEKEVRDSGGIILKKDDISTVNPARRQESVIPLQRSSLSDRQVEALRSGDLEKAFGSRFKNKKLGRNLRLPGGRMHLIDRIPEFNPNGGRFGLGSITAEADIHPDDWFLTCHFIDDRVMPGTLMYDCCAHALRIFTLRIGWISDRDDVYYDILLNNESDLKCRGPVTPDTQKATYTIEVKEMGYSPEPYIIADAHMFSDDLRIVLYKDMGFKIAGLTKNDILSVWREK